ncbi:MAG: hypothetical protein RMI91_12795 [Gemmatales bacterium]|nr:hypothetical protein [Gemmatales bacterium]
MARGRTRLEEVAHFEIRRETGGFVITSKKGSRQDAYAELVLQAVSDTSHTAADFRDQFLLQDGAVVHVQSQRGAGGLPEFIVRVLEPAWTSKLYARVRSALITLFILVLGALLCYGAIRLIKEQWPAFYAQLGLATSPVQVVTTKEVEKLPEQLRQHLLKPELKQNLDRLVDLLETLDKVFNEAQANKAVNEATVSVNFVYTVPDGSDKSRKIPRPARQWKETAELVKVLREIIHLAERQNP